MFSEVFPIVQTTDVNRALNFYRDLLGGIVSYEYSDPQGRLVYAGVQIGPSQLGLALSPAGGDPSSPRRISIWTYAEDCDAAVARLQSSGVQVVQAPADQDWGERIARVLDPDGNEVIIGQRAEGAEGRSESFGAKLLSPEPHRYTRIEHERRFLVAPQSRWRDFVQPFWKRFDDVYLRHTRLRLRTLTDSDTGLQFIKLTKKLESSSPYSQMMGAIPLSPIEYSLIEGLQGDRLAKSRYYHFEGDHVFSVDVFEEELAGLVLCEVEAERVEELMLIEPPEYAVVEVTEDPFFTGGNLCRISRDELTRKLQSMGVRPEDPSRGSRNLTFRRRGSDPTSST